MNKMEAEELFMDAVTEDKTVILEMSKKETLVFRVLVSRILKDLEASGYPIYQSARLFGIERSGEKTVIKKRDVSRYNVHYVLEDGTTVKKGELK